MKFKDIKFTPTKIPKGIQALVQFGDYELSIIQNEMSYCSPSLYEVAVYRDDKIIEMPGITEENGGVQGWLNESNVEGVMKKMYTITREEPINLVDTIPH